MNIEIERIRGALRGRRLSVLAAELDVPLPTIETFVHGRAGLAPALLNGLARILALPDKTLPAPAPVPRNIMRLTARALKCTLVLDASELADLGNGSARVGLAISVGGQSFSAEVAAKSIRKCRVVIAEHGADKVALLIQGRLVGNAIVEAGLVAQVKLPRAEAT